MENEPLLMRPAQTDLWFFQSNTKPVWDMYKKAVASFWTVEEVDLSMTAMTGKNWASRESILLRTSWRSSRPWWYRERKFVGAIYAWAHRHRGQVLLWFPIVLRTSSWDVFAAYWYVKDAEKKNKLECCWDDPHIQKRQIGLWNGLTIRSRPHQRWSPSPLWRESFSAGLSVQFIGLRSVGWCRSWLFSNELISRDEAPTEFAVLMYSMSNKKCDEETVKEITSGITEKEFINDSIPCRLIGMNSDMMSQYIEFVADRLIVQLGYKKGSRHQKPIRLWKWFRWKARRTSLRSGSATTPKLGWKTIQWNQSWCLMPIFNKINCKKPKNKFLITFFFLFMCISASWVSFFFSFNFEWHSSFSHSSLGQPGGHALRALLVIHSPATRGSWIDNQSAGGRNYSSRFRGVCL